jgi:hypothetical protein
MQEEMEQEVVQQVREVVEQPQQEEMRYLEVVDVLNQVLLEEQEQRIVLQDVQ